MGSRINHYRNYHIIVDFDSKNTQIALLPHRPTEDYFAIPNLLAFTEKPLIPENLRALVTLPNLAPLQNGQVYVEYGGQKIYYQQSGSITREIEEAIFALLALLIESYPRIISLGGAAVPILEPIKSDNTHPLQPFTHQLLADVARDYSSHDEAVERLAMQVGNDTDPVRRLRYPKMSCIISSVCTLSHNTLKVLQRTFGEVIHAPSTPL